MRVAATTNELFESDLFNESLDPVHKAGLNDLFPNVTEMVLVFNSQTQ